MLQLLARMVRRLRQQRLKITLEGWYYLVIMGFVLVGALLRQINLLVVLYGMMAGPLLVSWRLVRLTLKRLTVRRRLAGPVCAGQTLVVELELANQRRRFPAWCVSVLDTLRRETPARGAAVEAEVRFTYLAPGESRKGVYRGILAERGRYRFGPLRLVSRFPLGLLRYSIDIDAPESLVVYPALGRLLPRWKRLYGAQGQGSGRSRKHQGTADGDFYGLRDYRAGDSRNHIHWRTTARRQTLVVRQFERQRSDDLVVVVDLWQPPRPSANDLRQVELALEFAATVVADASRQAGRTLRLGLATAEPHTLGGPASAPLMHECLEMMALARATSDEVLPELLYDALSAATSSARIVLISTRQVDLHDARRFARVHADGRLAGRVARIHQIATTDAELANYFTAAGDGVVADPAAPHDKPARKRPQHA